MATTFIEDNNDKGFWIHESFMQLAFHYIYEELSKSQYTVTNKNQLLEEIKFHIDGYSSDSMLLGWYGFIESTAEKQTMIQVLENAKTYLQSQGTYLSVLQLQAIPTEDNDFKRLYSKKPFPISELIKIFNALIQMLQDTWTSDNYDMKINWTF